MLFHWADSKFIRIFEERILRRRNIKESSERENLSESFDSELRKEKINAAEFTGAIEHTLGDAKKGSATIANLFDALKFSDCTLGGRTSGGALANPKT